MSSNKGQITLFIIIGLLLLVGVAAGLYVYFQERSPISVDGSDTEQSIEGGVSSCLEEATILGTYLVSSQGGIFESDSKTLVMAYNDVRLSLYDGVDVRIGVGDVEDSIERYLNATLQDCIDDVLIAHGESPRIVDMSVKVSLLEDGVQGELDYPIIFSQPDGRETTLGRQVVIVPLRLLKIIRVADSITDFSISNPGVLDFGFLSGRDFSVEVTPYGDSFILYSVIDDVPNVLRKGDLTWNFGMKVSKLQNPKIDFIQSYSVNTGDTLTHKVKILEGGGQSLSYNISSSPKTDILIDPVAGVISYTPKVAGRYSFDVCVNASTGKDCKSFGVNVIAKR